MHVQYLMSIWLVPIASKGNGISVIHGGGGYLRKVALVCVLEYLATESCCWVEIG